MQLKGVGAVLGKRVSRLLLLALVAAPLAVAASASPAAAIACSPGDTVEVKVEAAPEMVPPDGTGVYVEFKALNCSSATESVTVVTKRFEPDPCSDGRDSTPMTFAPHQKIKKTLAFVPTCAGKWRFTLVVFQGDTKVSKSWADFTVL